MKRELEEVRVWARNRIESGAVPEWSWSQHVALIEAVDSILHDMAFSAEDARRPTSAGLRLVGSADARSLTELSLGMTQPTQYQHRMYPQKKRAGNPH